MSRNTVLVLGANGRLGLAAAQAFAKAGWQVLAQVRREASPELPAGAIVLRHDYVDTAALLRAAREHSDEVTAVVHGLNPIYTDEAWNREAMPMALAGMRLARALDALFMLPGNVYNFGSQMPPVLREDTPWAPTTRKGEIRCEIEQEMEQQAAQGLRSVVIRAGDYYGGGPGVWMDQMILKSLASGKLVYPGPRDLPHAWAYLPDVGRTFVAVAEKRAQLPAFANLHFPGQTLTGTQLMDQLEAAARQLGVAGPVALKRGGLPWFVVRLAGVVLPIWRSIAAMSYLWRTPHQLDGSRLQALLGEIPQTAPEVCFRDTLTALGHGPAAAHPGSAKAA